MTILRKIFIVLITLSVAMAALTSCIEDSFATSASDQPVFSTDTVRMGSLFTLDASPTFRVTVYNRHDKMLNLNSVGFADNDRGIFRINVDGMSGSSFSNVEIRPNDSIFVFVEATLPENGRNLPVDIVSHIEFRCNGVASQLPVKATGRDVVRFSGNTRIDATTTFTADKPYHITDSLVVEPGMTLTIAAGAEIFMHSEAEIIVHGSLRVEGTAENPVNITGDRFGNVAASIPYEIMSGQWGGIYFTETSTDNYISHASIRNSEYGMILDQSPGAPALTIVNSQVRNTKGLVLQAYHSSVVAAGCEFAEASLGLVRLTGGVQQFNHCTFANYYLFSALGGPALQLEHLSDEFVETDNDGVASSLPYMQADFSNCIIYGNGSDLSHGDLAGTNVTLRRCLLKSAGSDDDNFISCLWDTDPLYYTVRQDYYFDYRVKPDSPAIDGADANLTMPQTAVDFYGTPRLPSPTIGAYQFVAE